MFREKYSAPRLVILFCLGLSLSATSTATWTGRSISDTPRKAIPGSDAIAIPIATARNEIPSRAFVSTFSEPKLSLLGSPEKDLLTPYVAETSVAMLTTTTAFDPSQRVLAFYGNPLSSRMGILGEFSIQTIEKKMDSLAQVYALHDRGNKPVLAFHLVYGTCQPNGGIGYINNDLVIKYIEYAAAKNMLVILDHQIGTMSTNAAMARLTPWLAYPNVHLALDPEWKTAKPNQEIGSINAEDLNSAQEIIQNYLEEHSLAKPRMLIVHQFNVKMIKARSMVKATFDAVVLVHTADGFGSPSLKKASYASNAQATNMPIKGFKLFFPKQNKSINQDVPLLSPDQVLSLSPVPQLIIYQ